MILVYPAKLLIKALKSSDYIYICSLMDGSMRILVANNHLQRTGGTENYTYALALELKRCGHEVEYFTFEKGAVSDLLESLGVPFMSSRKYDLILANHNTCVRKLYKRGFTIQTSHGTIPELERPTSKADLFVSVTEEIRAHILKTKGYKSDVVLNGIDCRRFSPQRQISEKLSCVLSLSQSEELNAFIAECCSEMGVRFISGNKNTDNIWKIEDRINEADLVVGIGRSLYDAMACGRCVLSYDRRWYMGDEIGDGYLTAENIGKAIFWNCSGRGHRKTFDKDGFIKELQKYDPADGQWAREYALENLNVERAAQRYIDIYRKNFDKRTGLTIYRLFHHVEMFFAKLGCRIKGACKR